MKYAWERRARRNAMHYIADFRLAWQNHEEFFLTGEDDVERFLAPTGWTNLQSASLLEIGCGVGRMTRHLASRFRNVTAIDVAASMIEQAKSLNPELKNVTFEVGSGVDLAQFPDGSFDYIISYIVFQHIPRVEIIYNYIRESLRVLKPGGRFRFQARNCPPGAYADTYTGAAIDLNEVRRIAEAAGWRVLSVSGQGELFCFVEIGKGKAGAD